MINPDGVIVIQPRDMSLTETDRVQSIEKQVREIGVNTEGWCVLPRRTQAQANVYSVLCCEAERPRVSSLLLFPTFWDFSYFFLLFHKIPTFWLLKAKFLPIFCDLLEIL